jgi:hypothetical protein
MVGNIEELPSHLICHIFSFLRGSTLLAATLVNKRWHEILNTCDDLWKIACIKRWDIKQDGDVLLLAVATWKKAYIITRYKVSIVNNVHRALRRTEQFQQLIIHQISKEKSSHEKVITIIYIYSQRITSQLLN